MEADYTVDWQSQHTLQADQVAIIATLANSPLFGKINQGKVRLIYWVYQ